MNRKEWIRVTYFIINFQYSSLSASVCINESVKEYMRFSFFVYALIKTIKHVSTTGDQIYYPGAGESSFS